MMKTALAAVLLALALGCSKPARDADAPAPGATKEFRPPAKDFLSYTTPPEWISEEPAGQMRKAQYRVPDRQGKSRPATLTFFSMSPMSVENITEYWRGHMDGAEASASKLQGAACPTTLVEISGKYGDNAGDDPIEGARFLGAMIETGKGSWYLKFVGPAATVDGWKDAYVEMLKRVRPIE